MNTFINLLTCYAKFSRDLRVGIFVYSESGIVTEIIPVRVALTTPKFLIFKISNFFSPERMYAMMSYVSAKFASTVPLGNSNDFFRSE